MPEEPGQITVGDHTDADRFELHVDGALAGFVDYRRRPDRLVLLHTEVDGAFEGRGLGGKLVHGVLDALREEDTVVEVRCDFIRSWIDRHPEYADLQT